jgi:hypothetical protein
MLKDKVDWKLIVPFEVVVLVLVIVFFLGVITGSTVTPKGASENAREKFAAGK